MRTLLLLLSAVSAHAATIYFHDDGIPTLSTPGEPNQALLVGFQAVAGATAISGMQFFHFATADNGHAITYALWADPTNDGDPSDATIAQMVNTTASVPSALSWETVVFPATTAFAAGDWFYAGAYFTDPVDMHFLSGQDRETTTGTSWQFYWPINQAVNLNALGSGSVRHYTPGGAFGLDGDFMIRAVADENFGTGIPEPASLVLAALGLLSIAARSIVT